MGKSSDHGLNLCLPVRASLIPGYDEPRRPSRYVQNMSQQPQTATRQDEPPQPALTVPGASDAVGGGASAVSGASTAPARRTRLRDLPRLGWLDVLAAALTGYVAVWNVPDGQRALLPAFHQCPEAVWAAVVLLCCSGILLRRVTPVTAVLMLTGALGVHLLLFGEASLMALFSCLVLAETCTSRLVRPWSGLLLAVCYLGAAVSVLWIGYLGGEEPLEPVRALTLVGMASTVLTVAALTGLLRRRSREKVEQALERAAVLAAQQDAERRLAVVRERQRIARDVHDLLGHSLSVIGMQAAGARAVLPSDPAAVDQALAVIGETSRNAVDEVRALVDVLRADEEVPDSAYAAALPGARGEPGGEALTSWDDDASGSLQASGPPFAAAPDSGAAVAPAGPVEGAGAAGRLPGLEELPALVAGARRAGLPVTLHLSLDADVPPAMAEAVYRLVQESLTNVLRHVDGAQTCVTVRVGPQELEAVVTNEAAPQACPSQDGAGREGTGLAAMRERVTALGGQVQTGPTSTGGWQVYARLPQGGEQSAGAQADPVAADAGQSGDWAESQQAGMGEETP